MKKILIGLSVMAAVMFTFTARAHFTVTVTCPDGTPLAGILVGLTGACNPSLGDVLTDANGMADLFFNSACSGQEVTVGIVGTSVSQTLTAPNSGAVPVTLILDSATCPTPPPVNHCWLTGGGTINDGKGQPTWSFGGNVNPGCSPTAGQGGNWNVVAHDAGLRFDATAITVLDCGNVPGVSGSTSPVTPFSFIDWEGTGILKGISGDKTPATPCSFIARYEDLGEPGGKVDALYLMAFDSDGNVLLLISGTPSTPATISPLLISTGNLQLHISSCP